MRNPFSIIQERINSFLHKKKKSGDKVSKRESASIIHRVPLSGEPIDLETAQNPDREDHVKFYTTENSQMAKGAEKAPAYGIDKFGDEDDTVDPEKVTRDDQSPGLSQRYN